MSRRLIIREAAEHDLAETSKWYEEQRPGLGKEFVLDTERTIRIILE